MDDVKEEEEGERESRDVDKAKPAAGCVHNLDALYFSRARHNLFPTLHVIE
jgi:hypothetical protein